MSKGVSLLNEHDLVHEDVLKAWDENRSVAVMSPHHAVFEGRDELIAAYDGPPALITWTTGTTGGPKGVVIPWGAVDARCNALASYWKKSDIAVTTSLLPANHSGGLITSRLSVARAGGKFVPFSATCEATCLIGSPRILMAMLTEGHPLSPVRGGAIQALRSSLKLIVSNGSSLSDQDRAAISKGFDTRVVDLYGASEIGGAAFDGVLLPGYEARIVEGSIQIRTEGVASGYLGGWDLPMQDGWFATPDKGAIEDGKLICLGRD